MTPVSKIKYWPLMPFKIPDTSGALSKLKELILLGYSLTGYSSSTTSSSSFQWL